METGETEDLSLPDDSVPWERLLVITTRESLDCSAQFVEFSPGEVDVVVQYVGRGWQHEADTLPRGAYASLLRYVARVLRASRIEVPVEGRSVVLRVEIAESEHGQRMRLHLPKSE